MVRSVEDIGEVAGKRILVRASLNVPIENGVVTDSFRLDGALKTIHFLSERGARVILVSHMTDSSASLEPIFLHLKEKIAVAFVRDIHGALARDSVQLLKNGEVLLLENIRNDAGEKLCDVEFAKSLASLADIFVADDFTVAHRRHAGVVLLPTLLPSYAGFQFLSELQGLTPALAPTSPSLAIIGGAKLTTKAVLIERLLQKYDHVFVGGALANDFFKARGLEIGGSLTSGTDTAEKLLSNPKIIVPSFVTVESSMGVRDVEAEEIQKEDVVWDIAEQSIQSLKSVLQESKTVLWNGPMGNFEKGFTKGTYALAHAIAESNANSIVGGGDTLASIQHLDLMDKFTFVSSAGGAMLDFLASGTLPGIEALESGVSV